MTVFLKTILFFCFLYFITAYHFIALFFQRTFKFLRRTNNLEDLTHLKAIDWARSLFSFTPGWSLKISGQENFPKENSSFVIVANHESATDILALYYLKKQFRWLAKKEAFKVPLIGIAMKWAGYISVTRGNKESHSKALEECKEKIRKGTPVLFFPEGTRSTLGHPKKFKAGAFKIAKDLDVPVLPIVLKGAGNLLKKGSLAPNKASITVKILKPEHSQENESVSEFTKRIEDLIKEEHAQIK